MLGIWGNTNRCTLAWPTPSTWHAACDVLSGSADKGRISSVSYLPHQLHIRIQTSPASGVGARQHIASRHLWPPSLPDRGYHLTE